MSNYLGFLCRKGLFASFVFQVLLQFCVTGQISAQVDGDFDDNSKVDIMDLAHLAGRWLDPCSGPNWCDGADLSNDSMVGLADLAIISGNWRKGPNANISVWQSNIFPTRLTVGSDGRIYVTDAKVGSVFIYNTDIHPIGQIKGISKPLGIAVDNNGRIFTGSDGSNCIELFNNNGIKIGTIGRGLIRMPNDFALDREGRLYVADSEANTVWVFDSEGSVLQSIGTEGDAQGEFRFPIAVTIAYRTNDAGKEIGELFVADQGHYLIKVFDLKGTFLRSFGGEVKGGMMGTSWKWEGKFVKIQSVTFDGFGRIHVADSYMNKIQILDPITGSYIDSYGSAGSSNDKLNMPLDIAIDNRNRTLVANTGNKRVTIAYENAKSR